MSTSLNEIPPVLGKPDRGHRLRLILKEIRSSKTLYLFIIPGIIYFFILKYLPLYFIQVAFKHYRLGSTVQTAEWAGLTYFAQVFNSSDFLLALKNTIIINFYRLLLGFPAPIILALLLNEVKHTAFKRGIQTLVYLPHFVSWVVIGGIIKNLLSVQGGLVNELLGMLGSEPVRFLIDPRYFRGILVLSGIWKEVGWGTIIYLATMSSIDPQLYESAIIDGANRFQQTIYITIPSILYVIIVLLIINMGNILNMGLAQIMSLYHDGLRETGLVLQYFVYSRGLVYYRYSFAAAAGLFRSVIALIMVVSADRLAKGVGQRGIF
jgi:putative aldouronate transport system permease protein